MRPTLKKGGHGDSVPQLRPLLGHQPFKLGRDGPLTVSAFNFGAEAVSGSPCEKEDEEGHD